MLLFSLATWGMYNFMTSNLFLLVYFVNILHKICSLTLFYSILQVKLILYKRNLPISITFISRIVIIFISFLMKLYLQDNLFGSLTGCSLNIIYYLILNTLIIHNFQFSKWFNRYNNSYCLLCVCSKSSIAIIFVVNDWKCLRILFVIKKRKILLFEDFFLLT